MLLIYFWGFIIKFKVILGDMLDKNIVCFISRNCYVLLQIRQLICMKLMFESDKIFYNDVGILYKIMNCIDGDYEKCYFKYFFVLEEFGSQGVLGLGISRWFFDFLNWLVFVGI